MGMGYFFARRYDGLRRWWTRRAPEEHERQLLRLYWNRAELKKALAVLQDEQLVLQNKIKQHEGATRRSEEQLRQLQAHLGEPDAGAHALVYFQLRALWAAGTTRLNGFSDELRRQQEERERRRHQSACEAQRAAELAELDERLSNARAIADTLQSRLHVLEQRRLELRAFWHYFERRDLAREIGSLRSKWEQPATEITDLSDERASLSSTLLPEFPGLSVEGRRIVNTATIAFAEFLVACLPNRGLALLAKKAMAIEVYDAAYGSRAEQTQTMMQIATAFAAFADVERHLTALKEPTERLRARALYRSTGDTVPTPESVGEVAEHNSEQRAGNRDREVAKLNVLAEDCWSLGQCLLK